MKKLALALLLLWQFQSFAQTAALHGIVTIQNSGKKPLPNAAVTSFGANPTVTNTDGTFRLVFSNKVAGDNISMKLKKEGYEVVNTDALNTRISSDESEQLKIWVCKEGELDLRKAKFYDINMNVLTKRHREIIAQLEKEKKATSDTLSKLDEQFTKAKKLAEEYSEKFATVNLDDVSELYKEAFALFEKGEIDAAISVLEKAKLSERADKRINEREKLNKLQSEVDKRRKENEQGIKEDLEAIKLQAQMYAIKYDYDKASPLYDKLLQLDSMNVDNLIIVAHYYQDRKNYDKSLHLNQRLTTHPNTLAWKKANAYGHIGEINMEIGKPDNAMFAYNQFQQIYADLQKKENSEFTKTGLAVSYEKLGVIYSSLGQLDKALEFFKLSNQLSEELYESKPKNENLKIGLAISHSKLGEIYSSLGQLDNALEFFKLCNQLLKELNKSNPKNEDLENELSISYGELGNIYSTLKQMDKALEFYKLYNQLSKELYESNPKSENLKHGLAISYSKLGEIYSSMGQLDNALEFFNLDLKLSKELYESNPKRESLKNGLAISYSKLGEIYSLFGRLDKALEFYNLDNQLSKELFDSNPKNENLENGLAISYSKLGGIYSSIEKLDKAFEYFKLYNQLSKKLYENNQKSENLKNSWAVSYSKLGEICFSLGELELALDCFDLYNQLSKELNHDNPKNIDLYEGLGISYYELGSTYAIKGKKKKALDQFALALDIFKDCHLKTNIEKYKELAKNVDAEIQKLK